MYGFLKKRADCTGFFENCTDFFNFGHPEFTEADF